MSSPSQLQSTVSRAATSPIIDIGSGPAAGIYLLRIVAQAAQSIVFGRFRHGQPIVVQSGQYLYIGSALDARGAPSLAHRVLRHLTRTNGQPPQLLRDQLAAYFAIQPPKEKRLRWHIDYLLDHAQVHVDANRDVAHYAPAIISPVKRRSRDHLNQLPFCHPVAPGLGASDHPGSTHLLTWCGTHDQWRQTLARLIQFPSQWATDR